LLKLRHETTAIEEFIDDFLFFREFNDNENILEKLGSLQRQIVVNHDLFETDAACQKFLVEKERQTLAMLKQGASLTLWQYETKSKTRAISLDQKMIRKAPLENG